MSIVQSIANALFNSVPSRQSGQYPVDWTHCGIRSVREKSFVAPLVFHLEQYKWPVSRRKHTDLVDQ
tara:strand:- start:47911 stop:48111 length:201 start_codon:yes stop_codon:yes gene_type:complete